METPQRAKEGVVAAAPWQRYYQLLLESLPDAAFSQAETGAILNVNAAYRRVTGFTRQELAACDIRRLFTPESYDRVAGLIEEALQGDRSFVTEAELVRRDGSSLPVELRAVLLSEPGWPVVVQYVARETGQGPGADESRSHETRFRLMAKNLTEMVLAYDMERRLTFANAAAETLTGYSVSELERQQFICWIHPDDRPRMLGHWERLFVGKSFYEEEYRLITKDGRMKWVAASWGPILEDTGRQVGVQGRERDITERRMAEETRHQIEQRLRFNERRYRTLFENSPFAMWEEDFSRVKEYLDGLAAQGVTNLRGYLTEHRDALVECVRRVRIVDINRTARDFYGAATKEEMLVDLTTIFDEAAYENFCEEMAVLSETNSVYKAEFQTTTLRGEERTVSMTVSLVEPYDWSRVIVSFFDITDRKHLEEQFLQSQKLESLGRLAGGIAHDFNNLLTVINGYSDLMLRRLDPHSPLERGLLEIKNAGTRGAELTQQLLTFSRKQVAQMRALNVNALIQESEGMLKRVIGEDIHLEISLDPGAGSIKADRGQIHQVLMNLVVNGREAMPDGGTLTIETRNVQLGSDFREEADTAGARPCVLLRVGDTGIGMDARTRQRLFEPFFTTKQAGKGTGLGLATVFGIVTQSGGHISVASEPGKGSVFSVYLPRMAASPKPETPPAVNRPEPGRCSGAILVVEDQDEVRNLTSMLLANLGYEILQARNGSEALALAAQHGRPIRLLLTDVIMPGMNGKEVADQLVRLLPGLKVLFMSGYTDRIMSENGVMESGLAFLQKPFTPDKLIDAVSRVLESEPSR